MAGLRAPIATAHVACRFRTQGGRSARAVRRNRAEGAGGTLSGSPVPSAATEGQQGGWLRWMSSSCGRGALLQLLVAPPMGSWRDWRQHEVRGRGWWTSGRAGTEGGTVSCCAPRCAARARLLRVGGFARRLEHQVSG